MPPPAPLTPGKSPSPSSRRRGVVRTRVMLQAHELPDVRAAEFHATLVSRLTREAMELLRGYFLKAASNTLDARAFVSALVAAGVLPTWSAAQVEDAFLFFAVADLEGAGRLRWGQLTNFLATPLFDAAGGNGDTDGSTAAALVAAPRDAFGVRESTTAKFAYAQRLDYVDNHSRALSFTGFRMVHAHSDPLLAALETGSDSVKLYDQEHRLRYKLCPGVDVAKRQKRNQALSGAGAGAVVASNRGAARPGASSLSAGESASSHAASAAASSKRAYYQAQSPIGKLRTAPTFAPAAARTPKRAATVLDVAYCSQQRQIAVATGDCAVHFYELDEDDSRVHFLDRLACPAGEQVGLLYSYVLDALLSWGSEHSSSTVLVWDLLNRCVKCEVSGHTDAILCGIEVPSLKMVATAGMDRKVVLWDVDVSPGGKSSQPEVAAVLAGAGTRHAIRCLAYSEQHELLVAGGFDFDVACWDLATSYLQMHLKGHKAPILGCAVVAHEVERALTADTDGVVKLWDISRGNGALGLCLQTFVAHAGLMTVSPSAFGAAWGKGREFVLGSSKMYMFKSAFTDAVSDESPVALSLSPATGMLALVRSNSALFFDGGSMRCVRHFADVYADDCQITTGCAADADQRRLFLGGSDGRVRVHAALTMRHVGGARRRHDGEVTVVRPVVADGLLVSAGVDGAVFVHDVRPGGGRATSKGARRSRGDLLPPEQAELPCVRSIERAHDGAITCLAVSRELSLLATSSGDRTVRVWDFQLATLESVCVGHRAEVTSVIFLSPFPVMASADSDGVVMLWFTRGSDRAGERICAMRNIGQAPLTRRRSSTTDDSDSDSDSDVDPSLLPNPVSKHMAGVVRLATTAIGVASLAFATDAATGRHLLWLGNDAGDVRKLDVTKFLTVRGAATPVDHPWACGSAYNPYQQLARKTALEGVASNRVQKLRALIGGDGPADGGPGSSTLGDAERAFGKQPSLMAAARTKKSALAWRGRAATRSGGSGGSGGGGGGGKGSRKESYITSATVGKSFMITQQVPSVWSTSGVSIEATWAAHSDVVVSLEVIAHGSKLQALSTLSRDCGVRIWGFDAVPLGVVAFPSNGSHVPRLPWRLELPERTALKDAKDAAARLLGGDAVEPPAELAPPPVGAFARSGGARPVATKGSLVVDTSAETGPGPGPPVSPLSTRHRLATPGSGRSTASSRGLLRSPKKTKPSAASMRSVALLQTQSKGGNPADEDEVSVGDGNDAMSLYTRKRRLDTPIVGAPPTPLGNAASEVDEAAAEAAADALAAAEAQRSGVDANPTSTGDAFVVSRYPHLSVELHRHNLLQSASDSLGPRAMRQNAEVSKNLAQSRSAVVLGTGGAAQRAPQQGTASGALGDVFRAAVGGSLDVDVAQGRRRAEHDRPWREGHDDAMDGTGGGVESKCRPPSFNNMFDEWVHSTLDHVTSLAGEGSMAARAKEMAEGGGVFWDDRGYEYGADGNVNGNGGPRTVATFDTASMLSTFGAADTAAETVEGSVAARPDRARAEAVLARMRRATRDEPVKQASSRNLDRKARRTRERNRNKKAGAGRRQQLDSMLHKMRRTEETSILFNNKAHGRFGEYSVREILEVKAFFDHLEESEGPRRLISSLTKSRSFATGGGGGGGDHDGHDGGGSGGIGHGDDVLAVLQKLRAAGAEVMTLDALFGASFPNANAGEMARMRALVDVHRCMERALAKVAASGGGGGGGGSRMSSPMASPSGGAGRSLGGAPSRQPRGGVRGHHSGVSSGASALEVMNIVEVGLISSESDHGFTVTVHELAEVLADLMKHLVKGAALKRMALSTGRVRNAKKEVSAAEAYPVLMLALAAPVESGGEH